MKKPVSCIILFSPFAQKQQAVFEAPVSTPAAGVPATYIPAAAAAVPPSPGAVASIAADAPRAHIPAAAAPPEPSAVPPQYMIPPATPATVFHGGIPAGYPFMVPPMPFFPMYMAPPYQAYMQPPPTLPPPPPQQSSRNHSNRRHR